MIRQEINRVEPDNHHSWPNNSSSTPLELENNNGKLVFNKRKLGVEETNSLVLLREDLGPFGGLLFGVGEEAVDAWHDLGGLAVDEPPEWVAGVAASLVVVVEDPCRPVLLGDPDFWVGGDVAHELHDADRDRHARRREDRVGLRTNQPTGEGDQKN